MFGADTPLVMDALQIAGLAAAITAGGVWLALRKRRPLDRAPEGPANPKMDLNKRVEVLERIATDQSIGLADEIDALRDDSRALTDRGTD